MQPVRQKSFSKQRVELDGKAYFQCTFTECELVYAARAGVTLEQCTFDSCRWTFGGAASDTIAFMTALYHHTGRGGRDLMEATFNNIRDEKLRPPPKSP